MFRRALCSLILLAVFLRSARAAEPPVPYRVGDAGSRFVPEQADDRYPDSWQWAKAGVEGGVPPRNQTPVSATLKPTDNIERAIDTCPEGVVELSPGIYHLSAPLHLKSHVILRGSGAGATILQFEFAGGAAVAGNSLEFAALEECTLRFTSFQPGGSALSLTHCVNCWVQNCVVNRSAHASILLTDSSHITLRDNIMEGVAGAGCRYEVVGRSQYNLLSHEFVRSFAALTLRETAEGGPQYNVLFACNLFDTDLRLVGGRAFRNLAERCSLDCWSHALPIAAVTDAAVSAPADDCNNVIYRCNARSARREGCLDMLDAASSAWISSDPPGNSVFAVSLPGTSPALFPLPQSPPRSRTLYPVSGPPSGRRGAASDTRNPASASQYVGSPRPAIVAEAGKTPVPQEVAPLVRRAACTPASLLAEMPLALMPPNNGAVVVGRLEAIRRWVEAEDAGLRDATSVVYVEGSALPTAPLLDGGVVLPLKLSTGSFGRERLWGMALVRFAPGAEMPLGNKGPDAQVSLHGRLTFFNYLPSADPLSGRSGILILRLTVDPRPI